MSDRIEVGETLGAVFALYREHAGLLLPIAFWLFLLTSGLEALGGGSVGVVLLATALSLVALTLYQGIVVSLVRDVRAGKRDVSIGDLLGAALPFVLPLAAAGILAVLGMAVGFVLLIVPGLYLLTMWAVIAPAIVIEGQGIIESFGRSKELVRGHGWRVFGVLVTVFLIGAAIALPLAALATEIAGGPVLEVVLLALAATVTAPIEGLLAAVLYFRLLELRPAPAAEVSDAAVEPAPGEPPASSA